VADIVDCGLDWQKRFNKGNVGLAVSGFSYGGYLTFLALTHPEAPWCCGITLWGCTEQPPLVYEMGMPTEEALRKKADIERSPAHQASRIGYPLLILHGARDRTAKETDVWHIAARVKASGVPCELVVFDDDGHGLHLHREEMYAHIFRFLDQHFPKSEMPNKTDAGDA
jgi:dipeptidyl aminopeptidase/acylaminoacyl peptidase